MTGDDLWAIASEDHEGLARDAALARADAEMEGVLPFLLAARDMAEYGHRSYLAQESVRSIAARHGVDEDELMAVARRRYELYREALMEGEDSTVALDPLLQGGGYGQGPERPDSHTEGPDFSGGYSEVPPGVPGGPDPRVTAPRPGAAESAQGATGSLRRRADANPQSMTTQPYMPPDLGTGSGSVDMGVANPSMGGLTPSVPAGMPPPVSPVAPVGGGQAPQQVTSSRDPVRSRVIRATAMIAQANPGLPREECERLGRKAVARYLRHADLTDSVMSNGPAESGGDQGGSGSGGGGGMVQHGLEWQGLKSMMPGVPGLSGGGGGAGAAGDIGELAEVAAV